MCNADERAELSGRHSKPRYMRRLGVSSPGVARASARSLRSPRPLAPSSRHWSPTALGRVRSLGRLRAIRTCRPCMRRSGSCSSASHVRTARAVRHAALDLVFGRVAHMRCARAVSRVANTEGASTPTRAIEREQARVRTLQARARQHERAGKASASARHMEQPGRKHEHECDGSAGAP